MIPPPPRRTWFAGETNERDFSKGRLALVAGFADWSMQTKSFRPLHMHHDDQVKQCLQYCTERKARQTKAAAIQSLHRIRQKLFSYCLCLPVSTAHGRHTGTHTHTHSQQNTHTHTLTHGQGVGQGKGPKQCQAPSHPKSQNQALTKDVCAEKPF